MKKILVLALGFFFCSLVFAGNGPSDISEYLNKADDIFQRNASGEVTFTTGTDSLGSSGDRIDNIYADNIDTNLATTGAIVSGAIVVDYDGVEALLIRKDGDLGDVFAVDTVASIVSIKGGQNVNTTAVGAATYDLLTTDYILHVTYTGTGTVAIDLKTAQTIDGRALVIKDAGGNASANNITITTEGGENIDGVATKVLSSDYESVSIYSDGFNWFIE